MLIASLTPSCSAFAVQLSSIVRSSDVASSSLRSSCKGFEKSRATFMICSILSSVPRTVVAVSSSEMVPFSHRLMAALMLRRGVLQIINKHSRRLAKTGQVPVLLQLSPDLGSQIRANPMRSAKMTGKMIWMELSTRRKEAPCQSAT